MTHPLLARQLAADYCCEVADVLDAANHFMVFRPQAERRRFVVGPLAVAAVNGKLLFAGREDVVAACREKFGAADGAWFLDVDSLAALGEFLRPFGGRVFMAHPFFLASGPLPPPPPAPGGCAVRWLGPGEIAPLRDDPRFHEAFEFNPDRPDAIGVAAVRDGAVVGAAGASADSPLLWQIGVDVAPAARSQGVASWLVALLRDAVIAQGRLPYYGTAASHVASMRVALNAGFRPAWAEVATRAL